MLAEREQIISQVETTLGEVGEIFAELGQLVNEQQSNIDHISSAIENTAVQASRAADELWTASKYQHRGRSRTCLCVAGLAVGLVLFLVVQMKLH